MARSDSQVSSRTTHTTAETTGQIAGANLMAALRDGRAAIIAGQCLQEIDQPCHLLIRQGAVELRRGHSAHGVLEGRGAAIMEIGRGRCHVAQARNAHDLRRPLDQRTKHTLPLEQVAADVDALMAGDAAKRLEQPVPLDLGRRQRGSVAAEPAVEPRSRRDRDFSKVTRASRKLSRSGALP